MMNSNYAPEIAMATVFITENSHNNELITFLADMADDVYTMPHNERWSKVYDWMQEHYPAATGSLITGISYWLEK